MIPGADVDILTHFYQKCIERTVTRGTIILAKTYTNANYRSVTADLADW